MTGRLAPLLALLAFSPLEAEQPAVREGNEKLLSGDPAGALERYQEAERAVGPRAELDYDRGAALLAQGKAAEAQAALRAALEKDRGGPLTSRALQNLAGALEAAGDRDGARQALVRALQRDPANEDARYNLEVLLRRQSQQQGKSPQQQEQGRPQPKDGAGQPQGGGEPEPKDQGAQQAPRPQDRPQPPQPGAGRQDRPRDGKDQGKDAGQQGEPADERKGGERPGAAGDRPLDRQDAERLLDALRARERNLPLGPAGRRDARRRDVERDW